MRSRHREVRIPDTGVGAVCAVLFFCLTLVAPAAQAKVPIAYGETQTGGLAVAGEVDSFTFSGTAGEVVYIRVAEVTAAIEPHIRLLNPGGFELEASWSYTTVSLDEVLLATSGTYTVQVRDLSDDETGDYCVHLQRVSAPVGATTLEFGTTVSGTVSMNAEVIAYSFAASAGDRVLAQMTQATSGLVPGLGLYDPNGTRLTQGSGTPTAQISAFELGSNGNYTLVALENRGTATGDYRLHLQRLNDPGESVAIAYGETHTGSILELSETRAYRLDATAGDRILVRLAEVTSAIEPLIGIYDPNGDPITYTWSYTNAVLDAIELTVSGTYTLLALELSSDEIGDFALHVQRTHAPAGGTALSWGETVRGNVVDLPEVVPYTFVANAGDRVLLRMGRDATTLGPRLQVYDPTGAALAAQGGTPLAELNSLEITSTGTHTVLAMDSAGTGSGEYLLHAQLLNDPGQAVAVAYGETHVGTLAELSEAKAYRLDAAAGDRILVRLVEVTSAVEPLVRIYDPAGDLITGTWSYTNAVLDAVELTASGTYTILALELTSDETGDVALHVQRTHAPAGATAIGWGETASAAVVDPPETIPYTFVANAGDRVLLRMARDATTLGPRLQVYDPSGAALAAQGGTPLAELDALEITSTGTHVVMAMDSGGTGSGAFYLHVQRLNDPGLSTPMSYGETTTGVLPELATTRAYRFSATAGDRVLLRGAQGASDIEPMLRLYDGAGQPVASTWAYTTAVLNAIELSATGDYTALVTELSSDETGDFTLHLQCTNDPAGVVDIAFGATMTGTFTQSAETVPYRITAAAGDRVLVRLGRADDTWSPRLGLYAPNGEPVGSWAGAPTTEGDEVLLEVAGDYSVFAMDNSGVQFGPYAVHVQRLNDPGNARSIAYGESWTDSLDELAQTRAFTFSASSGDSVVIQMVDLVDDLEPALRLYDPSGVLLASHWSYTVAGVGYRLAGAGTYTILALDLYSDETGAFRIDLVGHATAVDDPPIRVSDMHLYEARPNPFNPSTVLEFDLPRPGPVVVDVYTIAGRRVARVVDRNYPAGRHEIVWRGEDDSGRRVASGTYVVKMRSGGFSQARKVALVQ